MKILRTSSQMRQMDKEAMHGRYAISPAVLMENAGHAVVARASGLVGGWQEKKVLILCGKGNNGGDGFVIARHLCAEGAEPAVYMLGDEQAYSDEAKAHLFTLRQLEKEHCCAIYAYDKAACNELAVFSGLLGNADVLVDAMVGTGFKGNLRQPLASFSEMVNARHEAGQVQVVAVDIASGINADTGKASTDEASHKINAMKADVTVTFGNLKRGFYFHPGRELSGQVVLDPIGMPSPLIDQVESAGVFLLDEAYIRSVVIPRSVDSHKGTHGTIGVVTGSSDMAGAALMCCYGALRSGGGKVFLRIPAATAPYCIGRMPEIMARGVGQGRCFDGPDAQSILKECSSWDVIAMGPGMGKAEGTHDFILEMIERTTCPIVLDADALNLLTEDKDFIRAQGGRIIMTPHLAEFSRLCHCAIADLTEHIIDAARTFAAQWQVTVVVKGAPTVIADPSGQVVRLNPTGNAGMAAGGMGDILTGMTAALVCHEGMPSLFDAAGAAVFLHGAAGDFVCQSYGPYGYSPMEVAQAVPTVISKIFNKEM